MVNQYLCIFFLQKLTTTFFNQWKGKNDHRKYFIISLQQLLLSDPAGTQPTTPLSPIKNWLQPSLISGMERMAIENISWSISSSDCCQAWQGLNPRPSPMHIQQSHLGGLPTVHRPMKVSFSAQHLNINFCQKYSLELWSLVLHCLDNHDDHQTVCLPNKQMDLSNGKDLLWHVCEAECLMQR